MAKRKKKYKSHPTPYILPSRSEYNADRRLLERIAQAQAEEWEEFNIWPDDLTELPPEIGELTQLKRLISHSH
jgi:hypothetical protein